MLLNTAEPKVISANPLESRDADESEITFRMHTLAGESGNRQDKAG